MNRKHTQMEANTHTHTHIYIYIQKNIKTQIPTRTEKKTVSEI